MDFFKASNDLAQKFMGEFEHFGGDEGVELEEPKEMDEPDSDNYDRVGHGNLEL